MRALRIFEHVSLDGILQTEDDGDRSLGDWTAAYRSLEGRDALLSIGGTKFDLLLGRRTYDLWSGYWPKVNNHPMGDPINAATKYIATNRPESLEWGPVEAVGDDFVAGVKRIKTLDGPDIHVWGSSTIVPALLEAGLVDDIVLVTYPVLIGSGKRFFAEGNAPKSLEPTGAKVLSTGVVINTFKIAGGLKPQPAA